MKNRIKNKYLKYVIGYAICFLLSFILFAFGTTYNNKDAKRVTIVSVDNNTISYVDSVINEDLQIKTIAKPKIGKYKPEDKIYIKTKNNRIKLLQITDDTINKIANISEKMLVAVCIIPCAIFFLLFNYFFY